jgi:hypothetical protein
LLLLKVLANSQNSVYRLEGEIMSMETIIGTTFDTEEQSNYKKVRDLKASWIQFVPDAEKARMQKLQCSKISCIQFFTDQHFSGFFAHTLRINKRLKN